jgi:hypothetical protein
MAPVFRSRGTGKSHLLTISGESERPLDSCCRKPAHLPGALMMTALASTASPPSHSRPVRQAWRACVGQLPAWQVHTACNGIGALVGDGLGRPAAEGAAGRRGLAARVAVPPPRGLGEPVVPVPPRATGSPPICSCYGMRGLRGDVLGRDAVKVKMKPTR